MVLSIADIIIAVITLGFGLMETIVNILFLKKNNLDGARKQHKLELAADATDEQVKSKIIRMLIVGLFIIAFVIVGLIVDPFWIIGAGGFIFLSGIIDTITSKKIVPLFEWGSFLAFIIIGIVVF